MRQQTEEEEEEESTFSRETRRRCSVGAGEETCCENLILVNFQMFYCSVVVQTHIVKHDLLDYMSTTSKLEHQHHHRIYTQAICVPKQHTNRSKGNRDIDFHDIATLTLLTHKHACSRTQKMTTTTCEKHSASIQSQVPIN